MLERPNTQFAIFRSPTVGDNQAGGISAMRLPGSRIRGVIVDNPSGSWVKLDGIGLGFQPYIQPYTLAWSVSVLPSIDELSASYVPGPIGQPSTNAGSPLVVYVFEAQVPSSGGSTFQPQTTEQSIATVSYVATSGTVTAVHIPAVANQRIRLISLKLTLAFTVAAGIANDTSTRAGVFSTAAGITLAQLDVGPGQLSDDLGFGNGIPLPVSDSLSVTLATLWGRSFVYLSAIYQYV
jgi:hypothetical protein